MEQNNFCLILGSRCNGRVSAQCEYLERAYEEKRNKEQAPRDAIGKIIKAYTDEFVELRKQLQKKIQQLKGQSPTTKRESIYRFAYMDIFSALSIQLGSMQDRIEKKVEDIIKEYEEE